MRYRKVYGARGVLEWEMTLRVGKARLRIPFRGGSMGSNGVIPAKYVTESRAVQQLIEGSRYFRCGKVYLHGTPVAIEDDYVAPTEPLALATAGDTGAREPMVIQTENEIENRGFDPEDSPFDGGDSSLYV